MNSPRIALALSLFALAACTTPRVHLDHACYARAGGPVVLSADIEPGSSILRSVAVQVAGAGPIQPGPIETASGTWTVEVPNARSLPLGSQLDFTWNVEFGYGFGNRTGAVSERGHIVITDPTPRIERPAGGAIEAALAKPGDERAMVELAWSDVAGNAGYRLRIRNTTTGIVDTRAASTGATSLRASGLLRGATYEWSVCALFADPPSLGRSRIEEGPWSEPSSFTVR